MKSSIVGMMIQIYLFWNSNDRNGFRQNLSAANTSTAPKINEPDTKRNRWLSCDSSHVCIFNISSRNRLRIYGTSSPRDYVATAAAKPPFAKICTAIITGKYAVIGNNVIRRLIGSEADKSIAA